MSKLLSLFLIAALACGLSACANKGRLKTPTQMELAEQKKAKKAEKEKADEAEQAPEETPAAEPK